MSAAASAASATHDHVMAHEPWKYVYPVTDGASIWLHVGCFCGKSTHVVELAVAWTPRPPEEIPCAHCGRLFPPKATATYCTAGCRREARNAGKRAARVAALRAELHHLEGAEAMEA